MADWSPVEVEATVADYLAMRASDIRGEAVNKAEHNRNLRKLLNNRSKSAVEFKHQNISAIMIELGLPPLPGYQPMKNYQQLLYDAVVEQIEKTQSLVQLVAADVVKPAASATKAAAGPPPEPIPAISLETAVTPIAVTIIDDGVEPPRRVPAAIKAKFLRGSITIQRG